VIQSGLGTDFRSIGSPTLPAPWLGWERDLRRLPRIDVTFLRHCADEFVEEIADFLVFIASNVAASGDFFSKRVSSTGRLPGVREDGFAECFHGALGSNWSRP